VAAAASFAVLDSMSSPAGRPQITREGTRAGLVTDWSGRVIDAFDCVVANDSDADKRPAASIC
jgi:hypothetical protein